MAINEQLKVFGLNDHEIAVYLLCLEKGESNLADISQRSGIARSTAKYSLEKLQKIGFINIVQKKQGQIYQALPPRNLITKLRAKKEKIDEQIEGFKDFLPELNQIYASARHETRVRYYQGEEIKAIYEEILDSPIDETLFIGEMDKTAEVLGLHYLKNWMKRRVAKNIRTRAIRVAGGEFADQVVNSEASMFLRRVRLAPKNFISPNHIIIYGNNVASISSAKENFGFVISSKDYAVTMKNLFKELWKNSTKF